MKITKCDICHKAFTLGYSIHVRPVSHARFDSSNINVADLMQLQMTQYDVCSDCMKGALKNELQKTSH